MKGASTRLAVAFVLGLLSLEVVSQLTGQYFSFNLKNVLKNPLQTNVKPSYNPLYPGQVLASTTATNTSAAPAASTAPVPGLVFV